MAQDAQRREMVRVDDTIEISHRSITETEREQLSAEILSKSSRSKGLESLDSVMNSLGGRAVDPNSPTWRALSLLDKKLDHLIFLLGTQQKVEEVDYHRAEINISGTGLRFPSRQAYKDGALIWLGMILPSTPPLKIETIAEVLRSVPLNRKHSFAPGAEISIRFVSVNPDDSEEILKYAFQRQREQLRSKRDNEF